MSSFFPILDSTKLKNASNEYFKQRSTDVEFLRTRYLQQSSFSQCGDIQKHLQSIGIYNKLNNDGFCRCDFHSHLNNNIIVDDLVQFGLNNSIETKDQNNSQTNSVEEDPIAILKSALHLIKSKKYIDAYNEIDKFIIMNSEIEEKGKNIFCYNIMSSLKLELHFSKLLNSLFFPYNQPSNMIVLASIIGLIISYSIRHETMQNTFLNILADYPIDISDLAHFYHLLDETLLTIQLMKPNTLLRLLGFSRIFFDSNFTSSLSWKMAKNPLKPKPKEVSSDDSFDSHELNIPKGNIKDDSDYWDDDCDFEPSDSTGTKYQEQQNRLKEERYNRPLAMREREFGQKTQDFLSKQSQLHLKKQMANMHTRKEHFINKVYQKWKNAKAQSSKDKKQHLNSKILLEKPKTLAFSPRSQIDLIPMFNVSFNYSLLNELKHNLLLNCCETPHLSFDDPIRICFCEYLDQIELYQTVSSENYVTNFLYNDDYYKRMYNYVVMPMVHQRHFRESKESCYSILPEVARRTFYQFDRPIYNSISFDSYGRSELSEMFKSNFNRSERAKSKLNQIESFVEKVEVPNLVCAVKTDDPHLLKEIDHVTNDSPIRDVFTEPLIWENDPEATPAPSKNPQPTKSQEFCSPPTTPWKPVYPKQYSESSAFYNAPWKPGSPLPPGASIISNKNWTSNSKSSGEQSLFSKQSWEPSTFSKTSGESSLFPNQFSNSYMQSSPSWKAGLSPKDSIESTLFPKRSEESVFPSHSRESKKKDDNLAVSGIMEMLDRLGKDKAMKANTHMKKNKPPNNPENSKRLEQELLRISRMKMDFSANQKKPNAKTKRGKDVK